MGKRPKDVDEYIAMAPVRAQGKLREVRMAIKGVAPNAVEGISYMMPYYNYNGRLAWFGLHKKYISLYLRPPVIEKHGKELADYKTTKSAVHLPLDRKMPAGLIRKLVRARMRINDSDMQKGRILSKNAKSYKYLKLH
ncbi:MAG: DUF1801 domain-containing protein [Candidatus Micrarchaeota archaeon]|nr:DUF1801 domain-containing protein [Candidatus Micrarchaeota archaeon]